MKKYKLRFNCVSFHDIVVEAKNKKEALAIGRQSTDLRRCNDGGFEFGEFLPVEEGDEVNN